MNRRRAFLAFCVMLVVLPSTCAAATPLQVRLRIVEACVLDARDARPACTPPQRRDEPDAPAPAQVQALTPPVADEDGTARPWRTVTF